MAFAIVSSSLTRVVSGLGKRASRMDTPVPFDSTTSSVPSAAPCDGVFDRPLILLVDDFEDALAIYHQYLDHCGYRVVVARHGGEAITAAQVHRPQLILMDLRMPVMSGTDAMRALRADPAVSGIPIIALTAHALDGERTEALAAGFDSVISKPCLPDELVQIVRRYLPV
jgi:two-component system, cell cycle response regulator DivK